MLVGAFGAVGDRLHEKVTPHERPLPGRPEATEYLFTVSSAPRSVDPHLESLELFCDLCSDVHVVSCDARYERAVGCVHGREQLGLSVYDNDRVQWAEGLSMVQRPCCGGLENARRCDICGGVLNIEKLPVADRATVEGYASSSHRLVELPRELLRLSWHG